VCNLDTKDPLYFDWQGPGYGTGWFHPPPRGKCATLARTDKNFRLESKSQITFTQHNETWPASAYLPKDAPQLPLNLVTQLITFLGSSSATSVVDATIRVVVQPDKTVTYILTWSEGIDGLAIGIDFTKLPEATRRQIIQRFADADIRAQFSSASEVLPGREREHLREPFRESSYLSINTRNRRPFEARFTYETASAAAAEAPFLIIDSDRRVVATGTYSTVQ
jgi:hypothetical protein